MSYFRYASIVVALSMVLPFVVMLVMQLTGLRLSMATVVIVPTIAAALIEGQRFATRENRVPTMVETRRFVILGTLIVFGFQALLAAAVVTNAPGYETILTAPPPLGLVIGAVLMVIAVVAICNLLFLRMGAKNQLKALKDAGKG